MKTDHDFFSDFLQTNRKSVKHGTKHDPCQAVVEVNINGQLTEYIYYIISSVYISQINR